MKLREKIREIIETNCPLGLTEVATDQLLALFKAQDTPTDLPEKKESTKYKECALCKDRWINEEDKGFNKLHDIATPIIQAKDREIRELKAEIAELKEKVRELSQVQIFKSEGNCVFNDVGVCGLNKLESRIATLEEDNRIIDGILQEKINELTEEFAITEKLQSRIATLEAKCRDYNSQYMHHERIIDEMQKEIDDLTQAEGTKL